jgi:hypothetical protein
MNQFEEFTKYYFRQVQEEENQVYQEEPKEEINLEEDEDNKINVKQSESEKKYNRQKDTSNRLNSIPKRYKTYTMELKKQIIQEVNIK